MDSLSQRTIDPVAFAEARLQEINQLRKSLTEKSTGKRVFQQLPKHLRRRAASHNPKRVPRNVRRRAQQEADGMPKPKPKNKKRRRKQIIRNGARRRAEFQKRQKSNKWLETHLWHTKRMRMVNRYGYRLALHPNEKSIRAAHRAQRHTCLMQDVSYIGCIEIVAAITPEQLADSVLRRLWDNSDNVLECCDDRYLRQGQVGYTVLYDLDSYPLQLLCPAEYIWRANQSNNAHLWIWVHAGAFDSVWTALNKAVETSTFASEVQVNDLRDQLVRFEFVGPLAQSLLQTVLVPNSFASQENENALKSAEIWSKIRSIQCPASLAPGNVTLGLIVDDARLRFPQRIPNAEERAAAYEEPDEVCLDLMENWPMDARYAADALFDQNHRKQLKRPTERAFHLRRHIAGTVPGTPLVATASDPRIPCILWQRWNRALHSSQIPRTTPMKDMLDGWTLILPGGFGAAFWRAFVYAGARCGALRERHACFTSSLMPHFPEDWPCTETYVQRTRESAAELKEKHEKRPPAKRVPFHSLGVQSPFSPEWESLLNTETKPWLLRGSLLKMAMQTWSVSDAFPVKSALVRVALIWPGRGTVDWNAEIYLPFAVNEEELSESVDVQKSPTLLSLVGRVTSGLYSLTTGHGQALGCVAWQKLVDWRQLNPDWEQPFFWVYVRSTTHALARPVRLLLLDHD